MKLFTPFSIPKAVMTDLSKKNKATSKNTLNRLAVFSGILVLSGIGLYEARWLA